MDSPRRSYAVARLRPGGRASLIGRGSNGQRAPCERIPSSPAATAARWKDLRSSVLFMAQQTPNDPRAKIWRQGDIWVAVGKPLAGVGGVRVRLNPEFLFFERGTLRNDAQQVPVAFIADVDAAQSMTQRARGVGTIRVHVIRPGGVRETVLLDDIPDHREGVEQINATARQARQAEQQARNTQHINYGQQQAAPPPPAASKPSSDEIFTQLERLGDLRDKGVISPEDFEAKKTELLGRL